MIFLLKYWRYIAFVLAVAAAWGSGYRMRANMADADLAALEAAHTATLTALEMTNRQALQDATDAARAAENKRVTDMAALDLKYTTEMTNAKVQADADIAALRDGNRRMRDRFTCSNTAASGSGVSATGAGSSIGNAAASGGLQQSDGEFLIRLAADADAVVLQLTACQAIVRADRE